jgi:hypothetical protein
MALGIEWQLLVQIKKFKDSSQKEDKYVGIYLYANQADRTG